MIDMNLPLNRRSHVLNRSGYVGVSYNRAKRKYTACTKIKGRKIHIGTYPTAELAYAAYLETLRKYGVLT